MTIADEPSALRVEVTEERPAGALREERGGERL